MTTNDTASAPTARIIIGWALIGTALLFALFAAQRSDNAFQAGQQVGKLIGSGLFIALFAWLITRKRSLAAQANARIVVGVLVWLVALGNSNLHSQEKKVGQDFLRAAIAMNTVHTQKFEALNKRFVGVDLSNLLTPQSITSAAGIAKARAKF